MKRLFGRFLRLLPYRHEALLGLFLLATGLLPTLAMAQMMGPPPGGGAPTPPTTPPTQTTTLTVTIDPISLPSVSSPGESFTPPVIETRDPEVAALKAIEAILPPAAKDKAKDLLAEIRDGKMTLDELEQSSRLYQCLLDETLDPQIKQFAFEFLTWFSPSDRSLDRLRKLTSSPEDPALARFAELRTAHDAAVSLTRDTWWAWHRALAVGDAGTAARLAGWSRTTFEYTCFNYARAAASTQNNALMLETHACESKY